MSYSTFGIAADERRDVSHGCRTKGISVKRVCLPSTGTPKRMPDASAKNTICCRLSTEPRIGAVAGSAPTAAFRSSPSCAAAILNCGSNCNCSRRSKISHPKVSNTGRLSMRSSGGWISSNMHRRYSKQLKINTIISPDRLACSKKRCYACHAISN